MFKNSEIARGVILSLVALHDPLKNIALVNAR